MRRYERYRDSGVDWLGEIPEGWEVSKIKYVASVNDDKVDDLADDAQILYVDISSVDYLNGIKSVETLRWKDAPSRAQRKVRDGDVIISTVRTYLKAIAVIDSPDDNLIVSSGFAVVRPNEINSGYAGYLLSSEGLVNCVVSRSEGVSYPAINPSRLVDISIPIPNIATQAVIAHYLDEKVAALDALIADKCRLLELYEEEKTALINRAVTRGLDESVELKDSGVEWLGEIPVGWEVVRLKYLGRVQSGIALNKSTQFEESVLVPYLRVANVQDGYVDLMEVKHIEVEKDKLSRYLVEKGNLLMNEGGDFDKLGRGVVWEGEISPCVHQNHVFVIKVNQGVDPYWLNLVTGSEYAKHYFINSARQSTNLASISSTRLVELPVVFPPPDSQREILDHLNSVENVYNEKIEVANNLLTLLTEYRTALISEAVTGKIKI